MWTVILKLLGIGLPAVMSQLSKERERLADAKTEADRINSQERIEVLEAKKEVIIQSQSNRLGEVVRLLWAIPFILYVWKLVLWDKVFGYGTTDSLGPILEYILWTVLGGYFILGVTDKFKGR